jgi:hypothetical protein
VRSQWPCGLRRELSSLARSLGSWVRIQTQGMDFCVSSFCVCVALCVGSGPATSWPPVQKVLPTVYRIKKLKNGQSPIKELQSHSSQSLLVTMRSSCSLSSFMRVSAIRNSKDRISDRCVIDGEHFCFCWKVWKPEVGNLKGGRREARMRRLRNLAEIRSL